MVKKNNKVIQEGIIFMRTFSLVILAILISLGTFFLTLSFVFGGFNNVLVDFYPLLAEVEIPKSYADMGDASAIFGGILSALAILLALWAIIEQKTSTNKSIDIQNEQLKCQNDQLYCQNALASLEMLRNACIEEQDQLNNTYETKYKVWYSTIEYKINRITTLKSKGESPQKIREEIEAHAKEILANKKKDENDTAAVSKMFNNVQKTVNTCVKRNMYRQLHIKITDKLNDFIKQFATQEENQKEYIKALLKEINEEMSTITAYEADKRK